MAIHEILREKSGGFPRNYALIFSDQRAIPPGAPNLRRSRTPRAKSATRWPVRCFRKACKCRPKRTATAAASVVAGSRSPSRKWPGGSSRPNGEKPRGGRLSANASVAGRIFFPQSQALGIAPDETVSPRVLQKMIYAGTNASSFKQAAEDLKHEAELEIVDYELPHRIDDQADQPPREREREVLVRGGRGSPAAVSCRPPQRLRFTHPLLAPSPSRRHRPTTLSSRYVKITKDNLHPGNNRAPAFIIFYLSIPARMSRSIRSKGNST
jgi:hypothetical protein